MLRLKCLLLVLLALVIPACGGDTVFSPLLLTEDFSGAFPGTKWTAATTTGAMAPTVTINAGVLEFKAAGVTSSATTDTQSSFGPPLVSFSVQLGAVWAAGEQGVGTIEIRDGTPTPVASMSWNPEGNSVSYTILGTAAPGATVPPGNGTLARFVFSIDSAGKGTWYLNNVAQVTNPGVITGPLKIRLGASFGTGTAWPEFNFDNVTVTNP